MAGEPFYRSLRPFLSWPRLARPTDWTGVFGRTAPLHVEIGSGNGDWLAREAAATPDTDFVGIEIEWGRVQKCLRKLAGDGPGNVRILQMDARVALDRLFRPRAIAAVTALFPEPWKRTRQAGHRLFGPRFLARLNQRLRDRGTLRIVTDHGPYADWIAPGAEGAGFALARRAVPPQFGTWFERQWHHEGQHEFHELVLTKARHVDVPEPEEVSVQTHTVATFDAARFAPVDRGGPLALTFHEFVWDPARRVAMVRATVAEESLVQSLWVQVAWRAGAWHVGPCKATGLLPTQGAQALLDAVRDAAAASAAPGAAPCRFAAAPDGG